MISYHFYPVMLMFVFLPSQLQANLTFLVVIGPGNPG
jgi:hypothetical protein